MIRIQGAEHTQKNKTYKSCKTYRSCFFAPARELGSEAGIFGKNEIFFGNGLDKMEKRGIFMPRCA